MGGESEGGMKELFEAHPDAEYSEAYEKTSDSAYDRYKDKFAAMCDEAKDRRKYD